MLFWTWTLAKCKRKAEIKFNTNPYWDCLVQMKSASASWFDLERPGEHVIQSLDIEEFL